MAGQGPSACGFFLLAVQAVSEIIKRIAFMQGLIEDPTRTILAVPPE